MGIFQFFKSLAVRNKVVSNLRANCPDGIKTELEALLADKTAVSIVKNIMIEAVKNGGKIKPDAVTSQPFPDSIKKLLADTPKLLTYIVLAARMIGKK